MKQWLIHFFQPGKPSALPAPTTQESKQHRKIIQTACSNYLRKLEGKLTLKQKKIGFSALFILLMAFFVNILHTGLFSIATVHTLPHESLLPPADIALPDSLNIPLLKQRQSHALRKDSAAILSP